MSTWEKQMKKKKPIVNYRSRKRNHKECIQKTKIQYLNQLMLTDNTARSAAALLDFPSTGRKRIDETKDLWLPKTKQNNRFSDQNPLQT